MMSDGAEAQKSQLQMMLISTAGTYEDRQPLHFGKPLEEGLREGSNS